MQTFLKEKFRYTIRINSVVSTENHVPINSLRLSNGSLPIPGATFPGKVKYIWYGFTDATEEDYSNNIEVAWKNALGKNIFN